MGQTLGLDSATFSKVFTLNAPSPDENMPTSLCSGPWRSDQTKPRRDPTTGLLCGPSSAIPWSHELLLRLLCAPEIVFVFLFWSRVFPCVFVFLCSCVLVCLRLCVILCSSVLGVLCVLVVISWSSRVCVFWCLCVFSCS